MKTPCSCTRSGRKPRVVPRLEMGCETENAIIVVFVIALCVGGGQYREFDCLRRRWVSGMANVRQVEMFTTQETLSVVFRGF